MALEEVLVPAQQGEDEALFPAVLPVREGVALVRWREADTAPLFALLDRSRGFLRPVDAGIGWVASSAALAERHRSAAERGGCVYVLWLEGAPAGAFALNGVDRAQQTASVGYWLGEGFSGRGLASAALRALLGLCFETLHLRAVEAATATTNAGSVRLLERAGFVRAAHLPQAYSVGGRWVDDWLYRLERQAGPRPPPSAG